MTKILKVSDETHERLTVLKGDGETIDDVIVRHLEKEPSSELQQVLNAIENMKADFQTTVTRTVPVNIDLEKIASEATPQGTSNRKVAGGRGAKATFTPADNPEPLEQKCCTSNSPCKHWSYEANEMMYVNSLSGRRKAPEE